MRALLLALLCVLSLSANAQTGNFAGIWQTSTGNYVSVHQKGSDVIAVILSSPENGGVWEAARGTVSGSTVTIRTIYGYVDATFDVVLTSQNALTATLTACSPLVQGYTCLPVGISMTATRIY